MVRNFKLNRTGKGTYQTLKESSCTITLDAQQIGHKLNDSEKLSNISLLDYDKVRETLVELFYNNQSVFITKDFLQY